MFQAILKVFNSTANLIQDSANAVGTLATASNIYANKIVINAESSLENTKEDALYNKALHRAEKKAEFYKEMDRLRTSLANVTPESKALSDAFLADLQKPSSQS